ncbi:DUF6640 family protein [Acetobacter sp. DsW_063]|uniref:DUF6640 family protein n=1 Tax=Acetobacter sp. DsW_063 TaxID=1514894 RepID=UPI000A3677B2|nr:DUF6640 family protein [Acetobacter sp. DsW_063]
MSDLPAQILLTLSTLGYSAIPAIFDSNETHMTNPHWVPHARFHVVWQVLSYIGVAALALYFIWTPDDGSGRNLWYASFLSIAAYTGFFSASLATKLYGGANYDENGVVPYRPPFLGRYMAFEVNITLFSGAVAILIMGMLCIFMSHSTHISSNLATAIWSFMAVTTVVLLVLIVVFVGGFMRRSKGMDTGISQGPGEINNFS